jgi:hypothetical protein
MLIIAKQIRKILMKNNEKQEVNKFTTELEKDTKSQFDHLSRVTLAELIQEEQPFLHIGTSNDINFMYEITLTLNNPNLFCLVDEKGKFRVEAHSSWYSSVMIDGYNQALIDYINYADSLNKIR